MPTAAIVSAAIGAGTSLISGHIQSSAATNAAKTQSTAANNASALIAPYAASGIDTLNRQRAMYGLPPISTAPAGPTGPATTAPPPIPPGSGVLPPGNPSTGVLTTYGPGWASYPTPPGQQAPPTNLSSFTNTVG